MRTAVSSSPRRTTVTLSPESLGIVERFKSASGISTSAAVNRIIQDSEPKPSRLIEMNGVLVLADAVKNRDKKLRVTLEDVKRAEDEMDREYLERVLPGKKQQGLAVRRARKRK